MSETASFRLGSKARIYFYAGLLASASGAETWTNIANVKDVSLELSRTETDANTRANPDYATPVAGRRIIGVTFDLVKNPQNTDAYDALIANFVSDTAVAILVADGDIDGSDPAEGPKFDAAVFTFTREEPIDGIQVYKVTVKPTLSETVPAWYENAAAGSGTGA